MNLTAEQILDLVSKEVELKTYQKNKKSAPPATEGVSQASNFVDEDDEPTKSDIQSYKEVFSNELAGKTTKQVKDFIKKQPAWRQSRGL